MVPTRWSWDLFVLASSQTYSFLKICYVAYFLYAIFTKCIPYIYYSYLLYNYLCVSESRLRARVCVLALTLLCSCLSHDSTP